MTYTTKTFSTNDNFIDAIFNLKISALIHDTQMLRREEWTKFIKMQARQAWLMSFGLWKTFIQNVILETTIIILRMTILVLISEIRMRSFILPVQDSTR